MIDQLSAWLIVGLIVASPWVLAAVSAAAAGAAVAWVAQSRRPGGLRDQRTAAATLARSAADAHSGRRRAEEAAAAYSHRAGREHARAAALAVDVHELSLALQPTTSPDRHGLSLVRPSVRDAELLAVAAAVGVLSGATGDGEQDGAP